MLEADWFMHVDADEVRKVPWQGVNLKDATWRVDQASFNPLLIVFHPVDETFIPDMDFEQHFLYWEFSKQSAVFLKINAWKNCGLFVTLFTSGGHEVKFKGRRVYPFKFLMKHYPIRGQAHGERKVLRERKARYYPLERALGWHRHWVQRFVFKEFLVERFFKNRNNEVKNQLKVYCVPVF